MEEEPNIVCLLRCVCQSLLCLKLPSIGLFLLRLFLCCAVVYTGHPKRFAGILLSATPAQEFVENWVMAARREHPLMLAWQALFNGYWNSKSRPASLAEQWSPVHRFMVVYASNTTV